MAHQNLHQPCGSMDWEISMSFTDALEEEEGKIPEFDLKYSVSQTLDLVQHDVEMAALENLSLSSTPSSSLHSLREIITRLAGHGGSDQQDLPQVSKDLRKMPILTKEPSKASVGSKSKESESSLGVHGETTEGLNAAITDNGGSGARNSSTIIDIPTNMTPSESSPRDDTKLGFTVSAVELLGALSNLAASPKAKEHQLLIYAVVISSAFAFLLSSAAFLLGKKKMVNEEKLQKAAFVFGAFGFLGIIGIFLPASIMWWFTISAFLVFLLIYAIANM